MRKREAGICLLSARLPYAQRPLLEKGQQPKVGKSSAVPLAQRHTLQGLQADSTACCSGDGRGLGRRKEDEAREGGTS